MRKTTAVLGLAAALALTPVTAASAEAHEAAARPLTVEPTPAPNEDNKDDGGMNGLWGLLGLAGLLGLIPRRPKTPQPGPADVRTEPRGRGDVPRNPRT